ncbi:hypothetical protein HHI36_023697 [Cryptolaemus montrouzieri]|uniref:Kazal-like domain-containing protein n=1 Tax=Cryptolaemus montrouzieri TaxID=559131 RepID=A0ABD2PHC6_9CUCU
MPFFEPSVEYELQRAVQNDVKLVAYTHTDFTAGYDNQGCQSVENSPNCEESVASGLVNVWEELKFGKMRGFQFRFAFSMISFIVLLVVLCSVEVFGECDCPNNVSDPLCASNFKMYRNRCEFNCDKVWNTTIREKPRFFCESCSAPLSVKPVCGSNGKTYPNEYSAKCDIILYPELNLTYKNGKCQNECKCSKKSDGEAVCSSLGKAFANECLFRCAKNVWYKELKLRRKDYGYCLMVEEQKFN